MVKYFNKNRNFNKIFVNSFTACVINSFNLIIFAFASMYYSNTKIQILIILIGFSGLIILLEVRSINSISGLIFGILSAISLSFLITIGEHYTSEFGGLNIAFAQLISAGFVMLYFTTQGFGWMIENIGISLFLGIFLTAIGLTTYWYVVKIIKPLSVSTITYLEPTSGVILGIILLDEIISLSQLIGFVLIIFVGISQVIYDSRIKSD